MEVINCNRTMFKQCVVVIFVFMIYIIMSSTPPENNGDSRLIVKNLTLCKGPKHKNCCVNTARILNGTILHYEMQISQDIIPDKAKIMIFRNGNLLLRLEMKNPCDHLFLRPIFRTVLKVTKDCGFKKGNYSYDVNMDDIQKYHGGINLYGNITAKAIFYNSDYNFSCTAMEFKIVPKNKTNAQL